MADLILSPIPSKICTQCGIQKTLDDFGPEKRSPSGKRSECRDCVKVRQKAAYGKNKDQIRAAQDIYRNANREKINSQQKQAYATRDKDKSSEVRNAYYLKNREHILQYQKDHREKNKEAIAARKKIYGKSVRPATRVYYSNWKKARLATDPIFKLKESSRRRIADSLRRMGYTKRSNTHEILGCDWDFFKSHIERQFTKGMEWEKMGKEIHIDHIVPMATANTEEEVIALNHFTNLRPLWAHDNLSKSDEITHLI